MAAPRKGSTVRTWKKRLGACGGLSLLCLTALAGAPALARADTGSAAPADSATAELDVANRLITDNGNPAQRDDFAFQINNGPVTQFSLSGTNVFFLDPSQTYTITGVPKDGFTTTYSTQFTCVNVTLDVNVPHLCQIINNDIPPPTTTTTTSSTTTTTTLPAPTTTRAVGQTQIHGSGTDVNNCTLVLDPALQPDSKSDVTVKLASDASPQPHLGDPIALSNTSADLSVPAKLIQTGVDVGLINDGFKVPAHITLVLSGSHTAQQTHTYSIDATATIHVKPGGAHGTALPLALSLQLPDTSWTPVNATEDVLFSEKSLTIVAPITLNPQLSVLATFKCSPASEAPFVALGATGTPVTVVLGAAGTTSRSPTATAGPAATAGASTELPRTGFDPWPLLVISAICIDLGLLAVAGTKRRRTANR